MTIIAGIPSSQVRENGVGGFFDGFISKGDIAMIICMRVGVTEEQINAVTTYLAEKGCEVKVIRDESDNVTVVPSQMDEGLYDRVYWNLRGTLGVADVVRTERTNDHGKHERIYGKLTTALSLKNAAEISCSLSAPASFIATDGTSITLRLVRLEPRHDYVSPGYNLSGSGPNGDIRGYITDEKTGWIEYIPKQYVGLY
jgi:hypothetical protein